MQMILKVPLLYHASLVSLKRVCESCLYPLEQGVVNRLRREVLHRHGQYPMLAFHVFDSEIENLLVIRLPN